MDALITVSHGSRHPGAVGPVDELSAAAGRLAGLPSFSAHLEFNSPSLIEVANAARAEGFQHAWVVPLLFTHGYHARVDLPAEVAKASGDGLALELGDGIGTGEDLVEVLLRRPLPDAARIVLYSVGSSDAAANAEISNLARRVAQRLGHEVDVLFATGGATLADLAAAHRRIHVLPLFVTEGLLLDRLFSAAAELSARTVAEISIDNPLGVNLAPIVAGRVPARSFS